MLNNTTEWLDRQQIGANRDYVQHYPCIDWYNTFSASRLLQPAFVQSGQTRFWSSSYWVQPHETTMYRHSERYKFLVQPKMQYHTAHIPPAQKKKRFRAAAEQHTKKGIKMHEGDWLRKQYDWDILFFRTSYLRRLRPHTSIDPMNPRR